MIFINGSLGDDPNSRIFAPYIGSFVRPYVMRCAQAAALIGAAVDVDAR